MPVFPVALSLPRIWRAEMGISSSNPRICSDEFTGRNRHKESVSAGKSWSKYVSNSRSQSWELKEEM